LESLQGILTQLTGYWEYQVLGLALGRALFGVVLLLGGIFLRRQLADLLVSIVGRLTRHRDEALIGHAIEAARRPLQLLVLAITLKVAVSVSGLVGYGEEYVARIVRTLVIGFLFWMALRLAETVVSRFLARYAQHTFETTLREFVTSAVRIVLFFLGLSAVLEIWGFNVVAVLGGLGLMGAGLAFGAKEFFADLLSGLVLLTERTADRGDWVRTSEIDGIVERIGIRSTRVRRFDKTLTNVPNRFLADRPLINFSRMTQRRIYWTIGVEYRTEESQLKAIVREISEYIHQHEGFETDSSKVLTFVFLDSFGDSSVNIMLYCFTRTTVWGEWLALKEELAYEVKRIVESHGATFAFPSTSLYVESLPFGTPEPFPRETAPQP